MHPLYPSPGSAPELNLLHSISILPKSTVLGHLYITGSFVVSFPNTHYQFESVYDYSYLSFSFEMPANSLEVPTDLPLFPVAKDNI